MSKSCWIVYKEHFYLSKAMAHLTIIIVNVSYKRIKHDGACGYRKIISDRVYDSYHVSLPTCNFYFIVTQTLVTVVNGYRVFRNN